MEQKLWNQRIAMDSALLAVSLAFVTQMVTNPDLVESRLSLRIAVLCFSVTIPLLTFSIMTGLNDIWTNRIPADAQSKRRILRLASWLLCCVGVAAMIWALFVWAGGIFSIMSIAMYYLWKQYRQSYSTRIG